MNKYFDKDDNKLIFEKEEATSVFWDKHWKIDNLKQYLENASNNNFVIKFTKKYLSKESKILEGGCGRGQFVYLLDKNGYNAYGVDYAKKTVEGVKKNFPDLNISLGDVRRLDFSDNSFDGYWSLGVIEHFYEGYDEILKEMDRLIKRDGFLFLTFPNFNFLRKIKAKFGFYKKFDKNNFNKERFYQFALDHRDVIKKFNKDNFELVDKKYLNGAKGLKDDLKILQPILSKIYRSKNILARIIKKVITLLFSPFCGHVVLLVFRKK